MNKNIKEDELYKNVLNQNIKEAKKNIAQWITKQKDPENFLSSDFVQYFFQEKLDEIFNNDKKDFKHKVNTFRYIFNKWLMGDEEQREIWIFFEKERERLLKEELDELSNFEASFYSYYSSIKTMKKEYTEPDSKELDIKKNFDKSILNSIIGSFKKETLIHDVLKRDVDTMKKKKLPAYVFSDNKSGNPLNKEQLVSLMKCHNQKIVNIQGPPGTGKTTLLKDLISSLYLNNQTIMVASSNNAAIDNVHKTLLSDNILKDLPMIRIGNKEIVKEAFVSYVEEYKNKNLKKTFAPNLTDVSNNVFDIEEALYFKNNILEESMFFEHLVFAKGELRELMDSGDVLNKILEIKAKLKVWKKVILRQDKLKEQSLIFRFFSQLLIKRQVKNNFEKKLDISPFKINKSNWKEFLYEVRDILAALHALKKYIKYSQNKDDIQGIIDKIIKTAPNTRSAVNNKNVKYWNKIHEEFIPKIKSINNIENRWADLLKKDTLLKINETPKVLYDYFPIIFSGTLSINGFMKEKNERLDYLIIDEAAQTNIHSILSIAHYFKNIIFLGDTKQLSAVVTLDNKKEEEEFKRTRLPLVYRNIKNSLPLIIERTNSPELSVMLKEHWRCVPDIANFFNSEYYSNQLQIKRENSKENIQHISFEEFKESYFQDKLNKIEKDLIEEGIDLKDVAIISPHKEVEQLKTNIKEKGTTHKFQGYENKIIIYYIKNESLKDNNVEKFLNDGSLINVGVSRAKERFHLYIGDKALKSIKSSKYKEQHEVIKLIKYIDELKDPNSRMNKMKSILELKNTEDIPISKNTYSYLATLDKGLYDLIVQHKLNISFGVRDIDINNSIKNIKDSKEIYETVISNKEGKVLLVINNKAIIYKDNKWSKIKSPYPENITIEKVKKLLTQREVFWLNKIKNQMQENKSESLEVISAVSYSKLIKSDYKSNKMHSDFIFAKKYFNKEEEKYYFKYILAIELDDATHKRKENKRNDEIKDGICRKHNIPLLRIKI